jgi:hypothetical protein
LKAPVLRERLPLQRFGAVMFEIADTRNIPKRYCGPAIWLRRNRQEGCEVLTGDGQGCWPFILSAGYYSQSAVAWSLTAA